MNSEQKNWMTSFSSPIHHLTWKEQNTHTFYVQKLLSKKLLINYCVISFIDKYPKVSDTRKQNDVSLVFANTVCWVIVCAFVCRCWKRKLSDGPKTTTNKKKLLAEKWCLTNTITFTSLSLSLCVCPLPQLCTLFSFTLRSLFIYFLFCFYFSTFLSSLINESADDKSFLLFSPFRTVFFFSR